jgi:hypothetical protein
MTIRFVVSVAALVGLTACGGGAGNLAGAGDFVALDQRFDQLFLANPILNAPALPSTGTPRFTGIMLVGDDLSTGGSVGRNAYLGSITVDADFVNGTVSGDAQDFIYVTIDSNFNPTGIDTSFSPDGSVSSSGAGFDENALTGVVFSPEFRGLINGRTLAGTGTGGFLGPSASYVSISEDCGSCDFTFGPTPADVIIYAN